MLLANLLFIVGLLCLVAAGGGLLLLIPQRTRTAGMVVAAVFGVVGVAATALAVLEVGSMRSAAARADEATAQATTRLQEYEARTAAEAEARERALRARSGWADEGSAFVTGAPATSRERTERVKVFTDGDLKREASCTFRHGVLVTVVARNQSGVLSTHVKSGECEGWLPVANLTNARPRPLTTGAK